MGRLATAALVTGAIFSHGELQHWLSAYGYLAVFALVGVESIGVPVPGETMLILAALYAGATGKLSIAAIVGCAAAGAIAGDNVGYALGRFGGWRILRRYGRYVGLNERRLKLGRYMFMRHGGKVVFFGRFVGVLRTYSAVLAGANHMRFRRFFAFNTSGGVIWAAFYGLGYYFLADLLEGLGTPFAVALIVIAVAVAVAGIVFVRRNLHRWEEEAERALPGPLDPRLRRRARHSPRSR